jgi:hypothetical protein
LCRFVRNAPTYTGYGKRDGEYFKSCSCDGNKNRADSIKEGIWKILMENIMQMLACRPKKVCQREKHLKKIKEGEVDEI